MPIQREIANWHAPPMLNRSHRGVRNEEITAKALQDWPTAPQRTDSGSGYKLMQSGALEHTLDGLQCKNLSIRGSQEFIHVLTTLFETAPRNTGDNLSV